VTLILVHCAHPQAMEHRGPGFGRLLTPHDCSRVRDTAAAGIPWAADNEAFSRGLNPRRFLAMVELLRGVDGCLFVAAPDVVGDWQGTRDLFEHWRGQLDGVPVAYVAQDGQPAEQVPWDRIAALFIGGSTTYKLSVEAERLGREAKRRGLWLHMGRVNSRRRYDYARSSGCDSIDGSKFSTWRTTWLPDALRWHRDPVQERLPL
jgi:hypothetical protein